MKSNVRQSDDLTLIKGIAHTTAQYLNEVGVFSFQDLQAAQAEEIEDRLKRKGHGISHIKIEDWQTQVRKKKLKNDPAKSKNFHEKTKGETIATFVVEFKRYSSALGDQVKTFIGHTEGGELGGGEGYDWDGFASTDLIDWMKERIDQKYLILDADRFKMETPQGAESKPGKEKDKPGNKIASISVLNLYAYQPPSDQKSIGYSKSDQIFRGSLKANQPFTLAINVKLRLPSNIPQRKESIKYHIQTYFTNRQTGKVIQLKEVEIKLKDNGEVEKTIQLPEISLESGLYRLQTIVTLKPELGMMGFLEVPLMQIA